MLLPIAAVFIIVVLIVTVYIFVQVYKGLTKVRMNPLIRLFILALILLGIPLALFMLGVPFLLTT